MTWQPIESAPKDGTHILAVGLWAGEINGPHFGECICVIRWDGGTTDYPGYEWSVTGTDAYSAWLKPTHWMPLPARPK